MGKHPAKAVPKANQRVELAVPEPILEGVKQAAEEAGFSGSHVVRQGIDKIVEIANVEPNKALDYVISTKKEFAKADEGEKRFEVKVTPERKVFIETTVEKLNRRKPSKENQIYQKDVTGAAAKWIVEELEPQDVRSEKHIRDREKEFFTKPPGKDRGGELVRMEISREAAEEIKQKAERRRSQDRSRLARKGLRKFLDWIEESPEEALAYILEERDYYQPPNSADRTKEEEYAYQFYAKVVTKRRLQMAQKRLDDLCETQNIYQRDIAQAVGRYLLEDFDFAGLP